MHSKPGKVCLPSMLANLANETKTLNIKAANIKYLYYPIFCSKAKC